jgi:hypothetical protein
LHILKIKGFFVELPLIIQGNFLVECWWGEFISAIAGNNFL